MKRTAVTLGSLVFLGLCGSAQAAYLAANAAATIEEDWSGKGDSDYLSDDTSIAGSHLATRSFDIESTRNVTGGTFVAATRAQAIAGLGDLHVLAGADLSLSSYASFRQEHTHSSANAQFTDSFTINPTAAHPGGSYVTVHARLVVDVNALASHTLGAQAWNDLTADLDIGDEMTGSVLNLHYSREVHQADAPFSSFVLEDTAQCVVGQNCYISGALTATAGVGQYTGYAQAFTGSAQLDVLNTSNSYFWVEDPDVTFTTGSGATYAVPEPSMLGILGCFALVLGRHKPRANTTGT